MLMDYSLLLVIEQASPNTLPSRNKIIGKKATYHIGIIDYLTSWSFAKKSEYYYKTFVKGKSEISCIHPEKYAQRFIKSINKEIFLNK